MLKLNFDRRLRANYRLGDIFNGYYFPCVLLGRVECYIKDIQLLFQEFLKDLSLSGQSIYQPGTFRIFARTFARLSFSYILSVTEMEDSNDVFDVLIGTIAYLFRFITIPDNEMKESLKQLIINDCNCNSDFRPITDFMDDLYTCDGLYSNGGEIDKELRSKMIQFVQCFLVYLLFGLSECQYVGIPVYNSIFQSTKKKPINLSLDTLRIFTKIVQQAHRWQFCSEVVLIIKRLVPPPIREPSDVLESRDSNSSQPNHHVIRLCLFDGPQYFYQDRYGAPLPFGYDRMLMKCVEKNMVSEEKFSASKNAVDRADKMNEIINEILTMKDSLSSDQPEIMNQLQQLLNEANDIRERLHNWKRAIEDETPSLDTSVDYPLLKSIKRPQSLQERLAQLQRQQEPNQGGPDRKRRTRRKMVSHRNPSGLASATIARTSGRKKRSNPNENEDYDENRRRMEICAEENYDIDEMQDAGEIITENIIQDEIEEFEEIEIRNEMNGSEGDSSFVLRQTSQQMEENVNENKENEKTIDDDLLMLLEEEEKEQRQDDVDDVDEDVDDVDDVDEDVADESFLKSFDLEDELLKSVDGGKDRRTDSIDSSELQQSPNTTALESALLGENGSINSIERKERLDVQEPRRRRKPVFPVSFMNPFDLEFEAMLVDGVTNKDGENRKGESKRKRSTQKIVQMEEAQRDEIDDDWVPESEATSKKERRPRKEARSRNEGRPKKEAKSKQPRQRASRKQSKNGALNRLQNSSARSTADRTKEMLEQLSAQLLHPSTAVLHSITEEEHLPQDQGGSNQQTKSSIGMTDEQLLRELDHVLFNE